MRRAGLLRHVVEIQAQDVSGQDALGNPIDSTYVSKGQHRARVEPLTGKSLEEARQFKDTVTTRVTIRYPGFEVLPTWRILWGGRELYVEHAANVGAMDRDVVILCAEEAPVGT